MKHVWIIEAYDAFEDLWFPVGSVHTTRKKAREHRSFRKYTVFKYRITKYISTR